MLDIHKIKDLCKRAFTPITVMFIPHSNIRPLNFKIPFMGIFISIILCLFGTLYVFSVAVKSLEYQVMKKKLNYYSKQFLELRTTITALRNAEKEFSRLFSLGSKERILENIDTSYTGSIDMENLRQQIQKTVETVSEIKDYLRYQKDLYLATPKGLPVDGPITSDYGKRQHPTSGEINFHSGVDVAAPHGSPVRATADGIVSFSGWNGGSGNLVVLEHGFGFKTFYAHNKMNIVKVGQEVKRGGCNRLRWFHR
ncbi:MAG: M23 family metallopeptidase [Thermodesulfovibrionales bacterium]|nr:M23 family metallopeptidase [Thermodesulfovibrionales bacterium]